MKECLEFLVFTDDGWRKALEINTSLRRMTAAKFFNTLEKWVLANCPSSWELTTLPF